VLSTIAPVGRPVTTVPTISLRNMPYWPALCAPRSVCSPAVRLLTGHRCSRCPTPMLCAICHHPLDTETRRPRKPHFRPDLQKNRFETAHWR
jgi:hypothetical protein